MKKWLLVLLGVCLFGVWGCSDDKAGEAELNEISEVLPKDPDVFVVAKLQNRDATLSFIDAWGDALDLFFPGIMKACNIDTIEKEVAPFGISLDPLDLSIVAGFVFDERLEPEQFGIHAIGKSINADVFIKNVIQTAKENDVFESGSPEDWVVCEKIKMKKLDDNTIVGQSNSKLTTGLNKTPLIEKALTAKGDAFYLSFVIKMEPLRPVIEEVIEDEMENVLDLANISLPETLFITLTNQGVAVQLACDVVFPSAADAQALKAFVDQVKDPMIQKFENEGYETLSHWLNTVSIYQQGETLTLECTLTPEQFAQIYREFNRQDSYYY